jgi:hypothetical protein
VNLSDLIRRRDRSFELLIGTATPTTVQVSGRKDEAVALTPGTRVILRNVHQFTAMRTFPTDIGWHFLVPDRGTGWPFGWLNKRSGVSLKIRLVTQDDKRSHLLFAAKDSDRTCLPVRLDWSLWREGFKRFDLEIEVGGAAGLLLAHGPIFNSGQQLLPALQDSGAEVDRAPIRSCGPIHSALWSTLKESMLKSGGCSMKKAEQTDRRWIQCSGDTTSWATPGRSTDARRAASILFSRSMCSSS